MLDLENLAWVIWFTLNKPILINWEKIHVRLLYCLKNDLDLTLLLPQAATLTLCCQQAGPHGTGQATRCLDPSCWGCCGWTCIAEGCGPSSNQQTGRHHHGSMATQSCLQQDNSLPDWDHSRQPWSWWSRTVCTPSSCSQQSAWRWARTWWQPCTACYQCACLVSQVPSELWQAPRGQILLGHNWQVGCVGQKCSRVHFEATEI